MNRRFYVYAAALGLLCCAQVAGAQTQVGADYFNQPTRTLINFDNVADGTLIQNTYSSLGVHFDDNDQAVAMDAFGTSSPNQASGGQGDLQSINVYFDRGVDAVGAWGYDFILRAFDADGQLIMQVQYSDGDPCPEPGNFREQRFLGIAGDRPIVQAQISRFYQNQTACGFRIDDLQYLQQPLPPDPTPLTGNIQINWNNCSGNAGSTPYAVFDCDPGLGTIYSLVGTFQVQNPFPNMIALDASFDVVLDNATGVAPFWHFESGGCNGGGVSIEDSRPAACTSYLTPWGNGGVSSDAVITAYQAGTPFSNYGRLLATVARSSDDPISLGGAPTRYYGWSLQFTMDNAVTCDGCDDPASIRVNGIKIYDQSAGAGNLIDQAGAGSQPCASINGGGSSCDPTPVTTKTWGQLKSLYR